VAVQQPPLPFQLLTVSVCVPPFTATLRLSA
jgi:hypothetical protein